MNRGRLPETVTDRGRSSGRPGVRWRVTAAVLAVTVAAPGVTARTPAQVPAASPLPGAAEKPAASRLTGDLSTRYHFIDQYAKDADSAKAAAGEIPAYQVANRDVMKVMTERPQGTPVREERTVQIIYTERPTKWNSSGMVTDTVRHYEGLRIIPADPAAQSSVPPLEGLKLWYRTQVAGSRPQLISLDPKRSITEIEYDITQRQIFLPAVFEALNFTKRKGDSWPVPLPAAQALLGDRPIRSLDHPSEPLTARLVDVRKAPAGDDIEAVVNVSGSAVLPQFGNTLLNAKILFQFAPPGEPAAPGKAVEARGSIREIRLARTSNSPLGGPNSRLKKSLTWEQILQRRPAPPASAGQLPTDTTAPAETTQANSWLTYNDPWGRFHFQHPQDFLRQRLPLSGQDDVIQFGDVNAGADNGRILTIRFQPPSGNPDETHIEAHLTELRREWKESHQDVELAEPPYEKLPSTVWKPLGMEVSRIQAALIPKPAGPEGRKLQRINLDHYLVVFPRNVSLAIDAMTGQDQPTDFRKVVEDILKTFKLSDLNAASERRGPPATKPSSGPGTQRTPAPAPGPAPRAPSSRRPPPVAPASGIPSPIPPES